jgi:predicted dehydrogenase
MSHTHPTPVVRRRIAVVGIAAWGRNWLGAVEASERWDLAAVVDLDDLALDHAVREMGVDDSICFKHFDEALEETPFDAVIISVPCSQRDPVFEAACQRGLHCLVEKPLAYTLEQVNHYLDLCRRAGNTVMVAHNYRFADVSRRIREMVRSGELGQLNYLHATVDRHLDLEGRYFEAVPHAALIESATQAFDLARMFADEEPVTVVARSGNPPASQFKNEPCAAAILEFPSGRIATIWVSWAAADNTTTWFGTWDLFFESGVLRTDGRSLRLIREGKATDLVPVRPAVELHLDAVLEHFADALDCGIVPECDLEENVGSCAIMLAAVESARTGKVVDVVDFLQRRIR